MTRERRVQPCRSGTTQQDSVTLHPPTLRVLAWGCKISLIPQYSTSKLLGIFLVVLDLEPAYTL